MTPVARIFGGLAAALLAGACGSNTLLGPASASTSGTVSGGASSSAASGGAMTGSGGGSAGTGGGAPVGPGGLTLATLSFAVVGDARPPLVDDVSTYPTAVVTKIWHDVEAYSPRPAFGVTTGCYMLADFTKTPGTQDAQLDLYAGARASFSGPVFPCMSDQECTGAVADDCGPGTLYGDTANYTAFAQKMLAPIDAPLPYYAVAVGADDHTWTAKLVVVACNYWSATQAAWLDAALAEPTTYTFVVRHEDDLTTTAPCLSGTPNAGTILAAHPFTLLFVGRPRTFSYAAAEQEVVVGNGGAPLESSVDYGYAIVARRADGAVTVSELDYMSNAVTTSFAVKPDGTPTP